MLMMGKFLGITIISEGKQKFNISLGEVSSCLTRVSFTTFWTR